MADPVIRLSIDASGAVNGLEQIDKATSGANRTLKDIRNELKEVANELSGLDAGGDEFAKLTQKAGALKDEIKGISESINANAGPAFENASNNASRLRSQLSTLDFDGAAQSAKGLAQNIKGINFGDIQKGIKGFASSIASLGKALLANPIFLIAAVVIAVGVAFVKLKDKIKPIGVIMDAISDAISFVVDSLKALSDWLGISSFAAEEAAQKQIEAAAKRVEALEKSYDQEIRLAQAAGKKTIELEIKKTKALLEQYKLQTEALKELFFVKGGLSEEEQAQLEDAVQNIQKLNNDLDVLLVKQAKETEDERTKAAQEGAAKRKAISDQNEKEEAARAARLREIYRDAEKNRLEQRQDLLNEIERVENEFETSKLSDEDKALRSLQAFYFNLKTEAEKAGIDITNIERIEEEEKQRIRDEFAEKRRTKEQEESDKKQQKDKEDADKQLQQERELQEAKFALAQNFATAAAGITDALVENGVISAEKGFRVSKAIAASQATIATYQGIVNALAAPSTIPEPLGSALKVANAVSIGAIGAANVAKILSQKFSGGGGGIARPSLSSGGGGGGNDPRSGFAQFDLSQINNRPNQPTPAYVLASDVKTQTEAMEKVQDRARL
jgi:hypothetical protein